MDRVASKNWHFSWFRESSLEPLIRCLGGAVDERKGDDWRIASPDQVGRVLGQMRRLPAEAQRKYASALAYLEDRLGVSIVERTETPMRRFYEGPRAFLDRNLFIIAGASESGECPCFVGNHPQPPPPGPQAPAAKYRIDANRPSTVRSHSFNAHNVRMIPQPEPFNPAAIEAYQLTDDGPPLMITGQLSGCSFAVLQLPGGSLLVAHIQPGGPRGNGAALKAALARDGRFAGYGARLTAVYGRGDYNDRASVIGVRRRSRWEIYGQAYTSATSVIGEVMQIV